MKLYNNLLFLTCECNEQVIDMNKFSLTFRSVDFRLVDLFPVNLLT